MYEFEYLGGGLSTNPVLYVHATLKPCWSRGQLRKRLEEQPDACIKENQIPKHRRVQGELKREESGYAIASDC